MKHSRSNQEAKHLEETRASIKKINPSFFSKSLIFYLSLWTFPSPLWLIVSTSKYFLKLLVSKFVWLLDHRPAKWFTLSYPCVPNSLHIMHISCRELCCMSCISCFLKTLFECMFIVNCLMFRLAERNEELLQLKLLPLPYCQRQVAFMKSPTYFCICMFSLLYLSYACVG